MAKVCDICERGGLVINWRSHSNIATKHKQKLNLQRRKMGGMTLRVCTSCTRSMNKIVANAKV
ncbi:MAG: L28 family ribosomal protein [bacterium]